MWASEKLLQEEGPGRAGLGRALGLGGSGVLGAHSAH